MSANHINAFCLSTDGNWIFAGDKSGRILVIDVENFTIVSSVQAHNGTIQAMAGLSERSLIATIGKDRSVTIWSYDKEGNLTLLLSQNTRNYTPDDCALMHHEGQTIALHPKKDRFVTTTGNCAVVEIDFSDPDKCRPIWCIRADPDYAIVTFRYHGDDIICGTTRGAIIIIREGKIIRRMEFPNISENFHWFEPLGDGSYIAANDSRRVIHFFPDEDFPTRIGNVIAKDDFEHIVYDSKSHRAYASSFDRNIYEIDLKTLGIKQIILKADFKLRWLRLLPFQPFIMIAQVRNGSLLKIDIQNKKLLATLKQTPPTLWSFAQSANGRAVIAGEGSHYYEISFDKKQKIDRVPSVHWQRREFAKFQNSYTKRTVVQPATETAYFARTDGCIFKSSPNNSNNPELINLGSAVRDIAVHPQDPYLFAACENGRVAKIRTTDGIIINEKFHSEPIWSLAYNPSNDLLAYAERLGRLHIVQANDFTEVEETFCRLPKRMRWRDPSTLLVTHSDRVDLIHCEEGEWKHIEEFLKPAGNTVEDYDWDQKKKYIITINYNRVIDLFDYDTGKNLASAFDGMDYMKGVAFLQQASQSGYGADFITFGRNGYMRLYRVHDDQIMCLGRSIPDDLILNAS